MFSTSIQHVIQHQ